MPLTVSKPVVSRLKTKSGDGTPGIGEESGVRTMVYILTVLMNRPDVIEGSERIRESEAVETIEPAWLYTPLQYSWTGGVECDGHMKPGIGGRGTIPDGSTCLRH